MQGHAEVASVVELYIQGMARGDAEALGLAFHPEAAIVGHFDGGLEWSSVGEFAAACQAEALPDEAPLPPWEIEFISVDGDTATVRVVDHWAGLRFRDTLTLLDHDGRWRIVGKLFRQID